MDTLKGLKQTVILEFVWFKWLETKTLWWFSERAKISEMNENEAKLS